MMDEKAKELYDRLNKSGFKLPEYDVFHSGLQDRETANKLHVKLRGAGYKLPDFDDFYSTFATEETVIEEPVVDENQDVPTGSTLSTNPVLVALSQRPTKEPTESEKELNPVMSYLNIFSSRIANVPADLGETWGIASAFVERQLGKLGVPGANKDLKASDLWSYKLSEDWREFTEEVYPVREGDRETFGGQIVDGLGQVASIALTGGKGAAKDLVKASLQNGTKLTPYINSAKEIIGRFGTSQGLIAGSQIAAPMYQEAIESGATEDEALQYAIENFFVGSVMETLPVQSMFSRLKKMEPNAVALNMLKEGVVGLGEEAVTEMWQETYGNMSAQRIYDVNRELLEGVGDAGAVGGTVGFILNAMLAGLTGRRARVNPSERKTIDDSIKEIESKIEEVDRNNERLVETVEELDGTNVRSLSDGENSYDFVVDPDGNIEYSKDGLTREQAESLAKSLSDNYDKMDFNVSDRTDMVDPLASPNFTITGSPRESSTYSIGDTPLTRQEAMEAIENAESLEDLEGLDISNDPELESMVADKFADQNIENEPDTKSEPEEGTDGPREEQASTEDVQPESGDQDIDGEVQETQQQPAPEYITRDIDGDQVVYERSEDGTLRMLSEEESKNIDESSIAQEQEAVVDDQGTEQAVDDTVQPESVDQDVDGEIQIEQQTESTEAAPETDQSREVVDTTVDESITPDMVEDVPDRVSFNVFGDQKMGTRDGDVIVGDDGTRYQPSMVEKVVDLSDSESKIQAQKEIVRKHWNDLKNQLMSDNLGIGVDFRKKAQDDLKFYGTVKSLAVEYAKLKGMQFNQFLKNFEGIVGKVNDENRKYLKEVWDESKKEVKPLPVKTQVKESTEGRPSTKKDTLVNEYQEMKRSLRERAKAAREGYLEGRRDEKLKAKDREGALNATRQAITQFVREDMRDVPVDGFTKSEVNKIVSSLNSAKTDYALNKAIDRIFDTIAKAGTRKRWGDARKKAKTAKANIKSGKIGLLDSNSQLDRMLNVDPSMIPQGVFDQYESIVDELGKRKSVLSLSERGELMNNVRQVMDSVEDQGLRTEMLADVYNGFEDKQYSDKGNESYSKTIDQMVKEDVITPEDADFMKAMRAEIFSREATPSDQDVEAAIADALSERKNLPERGNNNDENKIIRFFKGIKRSDLETLDYRDVVNVSRVMDNLSNGYVPHLAERIRSKVEGQRGTKNITPILSNYKGSPWNLVSRTKAGLKNIFSPNSTSELKEKIRRNPIAYIDQTIGNFKNTLLYENVFGKLSSGYAGFESDIRTVGEKLRRAESNLKNQFESRSKLMMIALQKEFESNPGQKVNSAKSWLEATINDRNSIYTKQSKDKLQSIFDQYESNGEFDVQKAEKSLTDPEKEAYKAIQEINEMLKPKADFTSSVIRGNRVPMYENYVHVPLAVKGGRQNEMDIRQMAQGNINPSTKAGTLTERTGRAHAIDFDIFNNVMSGAKKTLMDYHMTPSIREVNQTMSFLQKNADTDNKLNAANDIDDIYREVVRNVIGNSMYNNEIGDRVINEVTRKGYQATLGGVGRATSEFTSNVVFAGAYRPSQTLDGLTVMKGYSNSDLSNVATNVKSSHASRLFDFTGMDSKHVDFSKLKTQEVSRVTGYDEGVLKKVARSIIENPLYRFVDNVQSFVVSKPDQLVARPMWFGTFANEFKARTGHYPSFSKISENDQSYMNKYAEAIEGAKNEADHVLVEAVASSNPFDGILRNQINPSSYWVTTFYKQFNSFMTRFPTYEYNSVVRGVNSLVGNGMLSKADGAKLIAASMARLMTYGMLQGVVMNYAYRGLASILGYFTGDELKEEEDTLLDPHTWSKEFISSIAMLSVNRNIGNFAKVPINYALERANKEFGEGITYTGEYDGFGDNIVYPLIPVDGKSMKPTWQMAVENSTGALSPMTRTAFRSFTAFERMLQSKKPETKEKYMRELMTRTPMEIAGNLGYVPFYKDVRIVMMKMMYEMEEQVKKEGGDFGYKEYDFSKKGF